MTRFRDNLIEILGAAIITLLMAAFIVIVLARSAITRKQSQSRPSLRRDWLPFKPIVFNCNKSS